MNVDLWSCELNVGFEQIFERVSTCSELVEVPRLPLELPIHQISSVIIMIDAHYAKLVAYQAARDDLRSPRK